jgi:multidrug resistance efflux pump
MTTPDMTKEYQAELKKLKATLSKDERSTNRAINKIIAARRKCERQSERAVKAVKRDADKAVKLLVKEFTNTIKGFDREGRNLQKARDRRTDAITRRIQILEGRLAS